MASECLDYLIGSYPGRQKQIELLFHLLGTAGDPLPESIYVYGDVATGKTEIVSGLLSMTTFRFAMINCIECYTARLLLEAILDAIIDVKSRSEPRAEKCDNMMTLVRELRLAYHQDKLGTEKDGPCVIVLDNCERLFELGEHYFPAFQKLQELTSVPHLSVIFISQILPEKFITDVPYIKVIFPQYSKDDVFKILSKTQQLHGSEEEIIELKKLFEQFIGFFLDMFYVATRDLNELKHQMDALYSKYVEPVTLGLIQASDTRALFKNINPHIRAAISSVYLPGGGTQENNSNPDATLTHKSMKTLDLPFYAKYFLIAAFLASYNSPKDDKRLFVKNHGKKKKRLVQDQKKENTCKELLGPKPFTLDRLLAIFYAIMEEKTSLNANLLAQISTLVDLRLLIKLGDDLDKPKYKCAVGIDCVEAVSRNLNFNVRKYMVS